MSVLDAIRQRAIDRPRFRGVLHTWCFVASIPIGVALVVSAPTMRAGFAAAVFAFAISAMFGISALHHRSDFEDHEWYRFRRLDHMGIYLCIGGGFTPFAMLGLDGWARMVMLVGGWVGASIGIFLLFLPFKPPFGMMNALFIALGWVAIVPVIQLWDFLGPAWMAVTVGGGLVYTIGALVVGARWPDPWPHTFGYHEIWHVMVAIAAAMHYSVVAFALVPSN